MITDFDNHAIRRLNVETAEVTTVFKDTTPNFSILKTPYGIAVDRNGLIYVVDPFSIKIQRFTKDGSKFSVLCSTPAEEEGMDDGLVGEKATMQKPRCLIFDKDGNAIFSQRHAIRMLTGYGGTTLESSGSSLASLVDLTLQTKFSNSASSIFSTSTTNTNNLIVPSMAPTNSNEQTNNVNSTKTTNTSSNSLKRKREDPEDANTDKNSKDNN